jgi:hypothetical protein
MSGDPGHFGVEKILRIEYLWLDLDLALDFTFG